MGKTLVVAEKPSVGRDIARVVGARERGNGFLAGDRWVVTWAIGHLITLCNPEELDEKYKKWSFDTLPILPADMKKKVIYQTRFQYGVVKNLLLGDDIDRVVCATDAGREGELIFRWIYEQAGCVKPVDRLWISSMTDQAIRQGFADLRPGAQYDNLYSSARCRAEADWLVGMNGSRGYTITYDTLLSVGRVQSPTLAILVERELERRGFKPEKYFVLTADFADYTGRWFDEKARENPYRIPFEKGEEFKALAAALPGRKAVAERVELKRQDNKPPLLYDLTQLQRDANRKFGWPASKTLKTAQTLYEKNKVITYPRTDSKYLSGDMKRTLPDRLSNLSQGKWKKFADMALASTRELFPRVINNKGVTDHHAIIPTGSASAIEKLEGNELKLFDLIARRFIAVFLDDQQVEKTEILTRCEGHAFMTRGSRVTRPGWSAVYGRESEEKRFEEEPDNAEQADLPPVAQDSERRAVSAGVEEKETVPPPPYTEASLLAAMEHAGRRIDDEELAAQMRDSGLGTPATRAAIIDRLIEVKYVERVRRILTPTEKGIALVSVLPESLRSPVMTGKWEKALDEIGRGEGDPAGFMEGIRKLAAGIVEDSRVRRDGAAFPDSPRSQALPQAERESLGGCPACGNGEIKENSKAFYCTNWRRTRCAFTLWKNSFTRDGAEGPELTPAVVRSLLERKTLTGKTGTLALLGEAPWARWTFSDGRVIEIEAAPKKKTGAKTGRAKATGAKKAPAVKKAPVKKAAKAKSAAPGRKKETTSAQ